ncbi:hypothetical protein MPNT_20041 [Candidatus Methylacidithermus pantelleriae]|uniref:Uncharacterized protein n=1 Tax=Candidatus Methylacidithermus pantelleriae TaxID=2744239 RepID=A0A8J2BJ22_9BACT|nr:hypothetical protein MPNT_20041 [Candidatus Methylacidithermus pantelleriae]
MRVRDPLAPLFLRLAKIGLDCGYEPIWARLQELLSPKENLAFDRRSQRVFLDSFLLCGGGGSLVRSQFCLSHLRKWSSGSF